MRRGYNDDNDNDAGQILGIKHNVNPTNILVHVQLLCALRGKELGFSWRVESSSKQSKAHS